MMIASALHILFPAARPGVDYEVRDDNDGAGPKIVGWNLPDPIPTAAQLTAATVLVEASNAAKRDIAALEAPTGLSGAAREWILSHASFASMKIALADVDAAIATKRQNVRP